MIVDMTVSAMEQKLTKKQEDADPKIGTITMGNGSFYVSGGAGIEICWHTDYQVSGSSVDTIVFDAPVTFNSPVSFSDEVTFTGWSDIKFSDGPITVGSFKFN